MWVPAWGPVCEPAVPLEDQREEEVVEPPEQLEVVPLRRSARVTRGQPPLVH